MGGLILQWQHMDMKKTLATSPDQVTGQKHLFLESWVSQKPGKPTKPVPS